MVFVNYSLFFCCSRDIKVEKLKGFGKFFKEKLKIKTAHMKGSSRYVMCYSNSREYTVWSVENILYVLNQGTIKQEVTLQTRLAGEATLYTINNQQTSIPPMH